MSTASGKGLPLLGLEQIWYDTIDQKVGLYPFFQSPKILPSSTALHTLGLYPFF